MRKVMNPDGTRRFSIDERLTKEQVQSFISLAASNQQKSWRNSAKGNGVEVDDATSGGGGGGGGWGRTLNKFYTGIFPSAHRSIPLLPSFTILDRKGTPSAYLYLCSNSTSYKKGKPACYFTVQSPRTQPEEGKVPL